MSLPFTVIGGYLGAGKTTLLNDLLAQADGLRVAVLVNDFGDINIDAALIADHEGDTISLANGCLCCSLTNGFAAAISQVLKRADRLDHIIVEASGVAEPGKIAQYGQMYELPLDGVLVVVDAEQIEAQAQNKYVGDTVLRQLAQADLLILNKTDLASRASLDARREWLLEKAPGTPVFETSFSHLPREILLGAARPRMAARFVAEGVDHATAYRTWTLSRERPVLRAAFERFAQRLSTRAFRAKGFLRLREAPDRCYLFQLVGKRWTLEDVGAFGPRMSSQVVVIGASTDQPAAPGGLP